MFRQARRRWDTVEHRVVLDCLAAGIERARPSNVVGRKVTLEGERLQIADSTYDLSTYDDVYVVGGGNAAGHIAAELADVLGAKITEGTVVTDDTREAGVIDVLEGNHPVPTRECVEHTRTVGRIASDAGADDLVLAVVAGGGSALLTAPSRDVPLEDLRETTSALLRSGATIDEINAVRKHLSELKGGQLAARATPASVIGLVFSDVVGDDLATIASGPIAPDETTFESALDVVELHDVEVPDTVTERLQAGVRGAIDETPDSEHPAFDTVTNHVLATGFDAVEGAAERAREHDVEPTILSSRIRGEARDAALSHVAIGEEILATDNPVEPPVAVISGGETTVTVVGNGVGGPNQEFALSAALGLPEDVVLGSVDTDGIDGSTDAAGALVDATTVSDGRAGRRALENNDAYGYLADCGALLSSGPTGTNVNDLRVMLVGERY